MADPTSVRKTTRGEVIGYSEMDGVQAWLGLPYARAERWRPPVRAAAWTGQRQALRLGEACTQFAGPASGTAGEVIGSEDCLTLNVYAPHVEPDAIPSGSDRLPVMFWIHGGDNAVGTSGQYGVFERVARRHRIVIVTINYRLGIFGWFRHPALYEAGASMEERSGNYGTLDQIAALEWVQDNIAAFGGDPRRITIFGESAGAEDVLLLMASPLGKGLFQRAISESGVSNMIKSVAQAEHFIDDPVPGDPGSSADILARLLVLDGRAADPTNAKHAISAMSDPEIREYLLHKSARELLKIFHPDQYGLYSSPHTFGDGVVLPAEPLLTRLGGSQHNAVPLIAGTNHDEYRLFALGDPDLVHLWFGKFPHVRSWSRYRRVTSYQSQVWRASGATEPLTRLRDSQGPSVWSYRFDWNEGPRWPVNLQRLVGAAHGIELPFVMAAPETSLMHETTRNNLPGRIELSDAVVSYWAEFAYNGKPGRGRDGNLPEWKPWENALDAERSLVFATESRGGIRMEQDAVTFASIKRQLAHDPSLKDDARERCYTYARSFRYFPSTVTSTEYNAGEYSDLGCAAFPIEQFRPAE